MLSKQLRAVSKEGDQSGPREVKSEKREAKREAKRAAKREAKRYLSSILTVAQPHLPKSSWMEGMLK